MTSNLQGPFSNCRRLRRFTISMDAFAMLRSGVYRVTSKLPDNAKFLSFHYDESSHAMHVIVEHETFGLVGDAEVIPVSDAPVLTVLPADAPADALASQRISQLEDYTKSLIEKLNDAKERAASFERIACELQEQLKAAEEDADKLQVWD